ncbi:MAG: efflux RND transporter periplasmic adaptor subunit [Pseudomonadota bacterium]|nr:efflux RND transporter periplasmic adaptor subunit [Pseudomonadota bacterium]
MTKSKLKPRKLAFITTPLVLLSLAFLSFNNVEATTEGQDKSTEHQEQKLVEVIKVDHESVTIWNSFSGRLSAVESSIIKPQVSGRITGIHFEDGQMVNEGDLILEIDTRPYKASVEEAQATLASARSEDALATRELERAEKLLQEEAIAQRVYDERLNTAKQAKNKVLAAQANLTHAEINLDYAMVKAPISGKISRPELTKGNLVQAGPNAPVLTTIVSNHKVYAEFEVDENTYLNHVHAKATNKEAIQSIPVKLTVGAGDIEYLGYIHSFDNQINTATGTIRARAIIDNTDGLLLPGMYANIQMANPDEMKTLIVPQSAIGTDQDRKFVYIVDDQNIVQYKQVKLGEKTEKGISIVSGLMGGERIIVKDIRKFKSGEKIQNTTPIK